jgi:hypothetical protein
MLRFLALCTLYVLLLLMTTTALAAEANADRFQVNHDIRIQPNDQVGDVTCINCSVYVLGRVAGEGAQRQHRGRAKRNHLRDYRRAVTPIEKRTGWGRLDGIAGRCVETRDTIGGDASMGGGGWVFLVFLLPFAFLGGIIALIIWLIQRSRRPAPVPAYTLRRS